jgi:hypothetical protein
MFKTELEEFVGRLKIKFNDYKNNQKYTYFDCYDVEVEYLRKYIKINKVEVCHDGSRRSSIFCFIDSKTGDIFKPATYKAPAKHARGNILSDEYGMECLDMKNCSVKYITDIFV